MDLDPSGQWPAGQPLEGTPQGLQGGVQGSQGVQGQVCSGSGAVQAQQLSGGQAQGAGGSGGAGGGSPRPFYEIGDPSQVSEIEYD